MTLHSGWGSVIPLRFPRHSNDGRAWRQAFTECLLPLFNPFCESDSARLTVRQTCTFTTWTCSVVTVPADGGRPVPLHQALSGHFEKSLLHHWCEWPERNGSQLYR